MEYTHRTLLRHLGLSVAVLALPFALASREQVLIWYGRHWLFFVLLMTGAILLGVGADRWVKRRLLVELVERLFTASSREHGFFTNLVLKWASCSRCVSWWLAGWSGFILSLVYWELRALWWQNLILWFLFSSLSASLSAATAVGVYFLRRRKKRL